MSSQHQHFMIGVKGIICQDGKVLIVRPAGEANWELPGGRMNEREDIGDAFQREMYEELGVKDIWPLDILHAQLGQHKPNGRTQLMLLFFKARVRSGYMFSLSDEHMAWGWVDESSLGHYSLFSSDKAAIQKFFARTK